MPITTSESFVSKGTQITSAVKAVVTTSATQKIIFDKMIVFNTNIATETIKASIENAGGSAGVKDQLFEVRVPGGAHLDIPEIVNIRLGNSQSLFLQTTTAFKVNLHLSGRKISG